MSVHTPDLDDVFFALTGQPRTEPPDTKQLRNKAQSTKQQSTKQQSRDKDGPR